MNRDELIAAVDQYLTFWEISGDPSVSPWPGDPDGGELRFVGALRSILQNVDSDQVTDIVSAEFSPGYVDRSG